MKLIRHIVLLLAVLLMTACPQGHGVVLSWQWAANSTTAAFRVYRVNNGLQQLVATVPQSSLTWTDSSVSSGQTYTYWVTAYDSGAESARSNTFTAVIP